MGSIFSCILTSVTWCFCSACGSLISSCCGNDKNSTVPPSANSGRKRSVLLLIISIILAFAFQYGVAPAIIDITDNELVQYAAPEVAYTFIQSTWIDGCDQYETVELVERCAGNTGVYRVCGCTLLFFILAAIAVKCKPSANREAWPAKYVLFLFLIGISVIVPNVPMWLQIYLNIARIGGILFICLQQVILIDMAFNWNESWVEKSDQAESEEVGAGKKWLYAIIISCAILFIGSIVVIGLLFHYFSGCQTNIAFISTTLVMCILVTIVQLTGEEGSLLSSGVIVAWATYLCYLAVSKNPNAVCNPKLGDDDVDGIILGIGFTFISLGWTGWSYTAANKLNSSPAVQEENTSIAQVEERKSNEERKIVGIVTNYGNADGDNEVPSTKPSSSSLEEEEESGSGGFANSWKVNLILGSISCWVAMALTSWGAIKTSFGNIANPDVGFASMWVIIGSQWLALLLYLWTLSAPRLFPDRDFS